VQPIPIILLYAHSVLKFKQTNEVPVLFFSKKRNQET